MKKIIPIFTLAIFLFATSSCSKEAITPVKSININSLRDKSDVAQNQMPPP